MSRKRSARIRRRLESLPFPLYVRGTTRERTALEWKNGEFQHLPLGRAHIIEPEARKSLAALVRTLSSRFHLSIAYALQKAELQDFKGQFRPPGKVKPGSLPQLTFFSAHGSKKGRLEFGIFSEGSAEVVLKRLTGRVPALFSVKLSKAEYARALELAKERAKKLGRSSEKTDLFEFREMERILRRKAVNAMEKYFKKSRKKG